MKNLFSLVVIAGLSLAAAPLTVTRAASAPTDTRTGASSQKDYDSYYRGAASGEEFLNTCPTYQQWQAAHDNAVAKYNLALKKHQWDTADYWSGYLDDIGNSYTANC